ncbi:TonB-dependent receptor [bacterium SCSIO 12696]|nr:TonB-dependent receptor [bacterium SCSIO 12696]
MSKSTPTYFPRKAIAAAVGSIVCLTAGQIFAEESAKSDAVQEEVVVTGSHIKRSNLEGSAPVQVLDRATISAAGAATVQDLVIDLPVNTGTIINDEQSSLAGTTQFNLRGLGLGSTLTLINGRRAGKSAVADGGGNFFFDINQLPLAMIDRIDVQTDGASAIYGSEAVAGVVNVVTRKGFEGFELSANYENATNSSGSLNLAGGAWGDNGGFNIYATYYTQTRNNRTDFDWLRERTLHVGDLQDTALSSANGAPGTYFRTEVNPETGGVRQVSGADAFPDPDCVAAGGILRGSTCRHIFADQNGVIHDSDRFQVFAEYEYNITETMKAFGEFSASNNEVGRTRGPGNYSNGLIESSGRIFIPGDHPFNFFIEDPDNPEALIYIGPEDWDNSIHTGADISGRARILGNEFNGRNSPADRRSDIQNFRALQGFSVDIGESWNVEASYMAARALWDLTTSLDYAAPVVNQLLIDGEFNPFGTRVANPTLVSPKDGVSVAGLSDEVFAQLLVPQTQFAQHDQFVIDVVAAGEIMDLPAGSVGLAVGWQRRDEQFDFTPSALRGAGLGGLSGRVFPRSGELDVDAYFAEVAIPVLDNVELQLALRYEDYGFTDTTDPKVAARWDINDYIALRGSFGSSFQSPTVLQTSEARGAAILDDPVGVDPVTGVLSCGAEGQAGNTATRTVGSDDLSPQSADNYNFGLIIRPTDDLSIGLDYWSYDYTNLISSDEGPQAIVLNDCLDDGIPNDPRVQRTGGGNIILVTSNFINTASVETDGVDLNVRYDIDTDDLGSFALGFNMSYINSFDFRTTPTSEVEDAVGSRNFLNQFPSTPQTRGNITMAWNRDNLFGNAAVRYVDSYLNDRNDFTIDSFTTLDLQFGGEFGLLDDERTTTITAGIKNVFDEDPPAIGFNETTGQASAGRPGYDPEVANIRGRIVYLELKQRF